MNDIVAADVNRDGRTDLVGVSGRFDQFTTDQAPGQVHVRLGNGNGTFQSPVSYSVGVRGTVSVVVGDFNADGRLNVATGNRSIVEDYDNGGVGLADSVSVLAGNGSGGFLLPSPMRWPTSRRGTLGSGSISARRTRATTIN